MRIWKYLVALADLSIGLLGLFVVIFLVTKPSQEKIQARESNKTVKAQQLQLEELKQKVKTLNIELSKAQTGEHLSSDESSEITIRANKSLSIKAGKQSPVEHFTSIQSFKRWLQHNRLHNDIVLKVDSKLPVQEMTNVIDAVKSIQGGVKVGVAVVNE